MALSDFRQRGAAIGAGARRDQPYTSIPRMERPATTQLGSHIVPPLGRYIREGERRKAIEAEAGCLAVWTGGAPEPVAARSPAASARPNVAVPPASSRMVERFCTRQR
jgi:hypothetical protein